MHFVSGGAFNGKRKWVKQRYPENTVWFSAYECNSWPAPAEGLASIVILEGIESWVQKEIDLELSADILLNRNIEKLELWLEWEQQAAEHLLVLIGTDITKGIVPTEKTARLQRDVTGWLYQKVALRAERVDRIWYGIAETLKNEKEREK